MVATIVLNQNNLVQDGNNNTFLYKFPNSVSFPHHEIAIQSVSMFYSWANIDITLANNTFTIYFPTNSAGAVSTGAGQVSSYQVVIPTGQYEVSDLNALLQYYCIKNGWYLINSAGQNVYFLEMFVNATRYAVQVNTFPIPSATNFTWNATTGIWTGNSGTTYAGWTTPVSNTQTGVSGWGGFATTTASGGTQAVFNSGATISTTGVLSGSIASGTITAGVGQYVSQGGVNYVIVSGSGTTYQVIPFASGSTLTLTGTGLNVVSAGTLLNPCLAFPPSFSTLIGFPDNSQTRGTSQSGTISTTAPTLVNLDQSGTNKSFLSSVAPQVQPNSSIYFSISNIENKYSIPNSIIFSLNPAVAFGLQINEYPPQFAWNKLLNGTYNNLRLQILGLNYQPLKILDPNMTIVLVIRDTRDIGINDLVNQVQGGKG
jgi:hypothetical protein